MTKQHIVTPLTDCQPEIGRVLWMLNDTRQRTLTELKDVTPTAVDWRGGAHQHSIGTLLYHIAAIEISWLAIEVAEKDQLPEDLWEHFPFEVRTPEGQLNPVMNLSLTQHLERLDYTRQLLLSVYKKMSLDTYRQVRHFENYDVSPEWVLHHLMQHEAGHRGEISFLRDLVLQSQS